MTNAYAGAAQQAHATIFSAYFYRGCPKERSHTTYICRMLTPGMFCGFFLLDHTGARNAQRGGGEGRRGTARGGEGRRGAARACREPGMHDGYVINTEMERYSEGGRMKCECYARMKELKPQIRRCIEDGGTGGTREGTQGHMREASNEHHYAASQCQIWD